MPSIRVKFWKSSNGDKRAETKRETEEQDHELYARQQQHFENEVQRVKDASLLYAAKEKAINQRARMEQAKMEHVRNASPEAVRRVRKMIRERYALDLYIWSHRDVQKADRPLILESCAKSDEILKQIFEIVSSWEEDRFSSEEWKVARKIKETLSYGGRIVMWSDLPPWERDAYDEDTNSLDRWT